MRVHHGAEKGVGPLDIGRPRRIIEIEPIEIPLPALEPLPDPAPTREPEPVEPTP